jgi:hypothetical protein
MNSYLPQRRRKKKRKLSGGGGKWPKAGYHSSLETRSLDEHSEENRSVDFGHKDGDDGSHLDDEGKNITNIFKNMNYPLKIVFCVRNFFTFYTSRYKKI